MTRFAANRHRSPLHRDNLTHEEFILAVRDLVLPRLNADAADRIRRTKIVYGAGSPSTRGRCYYELWHSDVVGDFIEVCAFGEESIIQLAGTTVHELAHVIAGRGTGHGTAWKHAAFTLGLHTAKASGQAYSQSDFDPVLWSDLQRIPAPADGRPMVFSASQLRRTNSCPLGIGIRKGRSRGPGSGSRLKLWLCSCTPPMRVRVARKEFRALCLVCGDRFSESF